MRSPVIWAMRHTRSFGPIPRQWQNMWTRLFACMRTRCPMLKVLFVDQFSELGGGQRILHDIVHFFSCEGVECIVALPGNGLFAQTLRNEKVLVRDYPLARLSSGRKGLRDAFLLLRTVRLTTRALDAMIEEVSPDVIFCNGPRCIPSVVPAADKLRVPVVCAIHLIFTGAANRVLNRFLSKPIVGAVTFCSRQAAEPFRDISPEKKFVVGN